VREVHFAAPSITFFFSGEFYYFPFSYLAKSIEDSLYLGIWESFSSAPPLPLNSRKAAFFGIYLTGNRGCLIFFLLPAVDLEWVVNFPPPVIGFPLRLLVDFSCRLPPDLPLRTAFIRLTSSLPSA